MAFGTLRVDSIQNDGGSTKQVANLLDTSAVGVSVQAFDADTAKTDVANTFTAAQAVTVSDQTTGNTLNLSSSNFIKVAGNDYDQDPKLPPVGTSGSFYVDTAAPTGWHNDFKFPTGGYTAPTAFPAIAPWYVAETAEVLVGSFTEGISDVSGN